MEIDGQYRSIKPAKDVFIVNIGETLQKISNMKIKATRHRVIDIGVERFSAPFFLEPKLSARISPLLLNSARKNCEDIDYENDPANAAEMSQLRNFADVLVEKTTTAYGEWKGFEAPPSTFNYSTRPPAISK